MPESEVRTIVISLGRAGDIVLALPCVQHLAKQAGHPIDVMVSEPFANILDGVSYARPVVTDDLFYDRNAALDKAREMGYEKILMGRISERNVGVNTQCESFTEEIWRQLGCLHLWNDLHLEFDRRDAGRERDLVQKFHPITRIDKLGLLNFTGKSSPFPEGREWFYRNQARIEGCFRGRIHWVDLGLIQAHRIYDLLGLMDVAAVLVTGDTATMHLAEASGVPTLNLIQDRPLRWHGSRPRNNSVLEMRYHELQDLKEDVIYE